MEPMDVGNELSWRDNCDRQVFVDAAKLSALFVVITFLNLLKGGAGEDGGGPMGLNACGAGCFWISQIAMISLIIAFSVWARWGILKRLKLGGPVLSEIEWDDNNTITYPLLAIVAGLVAGLFGVGGGIIKGPLMLALGK
jgi:hypothetical protein